MSQDQFFNTEEDIDGTFTDAFCSTSLNRDTDQIMDKIRKLVEPCGNFQGFLAYHSMGGGAGCGLSARILQKLTDQYSNKKIRMDFAIYDSGRHSPETYNAVLGTHAMFDHTQCTFILDNAAIKDICS